MVTEGNVVKDYYIGKTHIKICDDYCRDTTQEQIDIILKRVAMISIGAMRSVTEQEEREHAALAV